MDQPTLSSRRAFLQGAPVAAIALALPAVANEPDPVSAELLALIGTYETSGAVADAAANAFQAAGKRLCESLGAANLSIRLGREFHHERIDLDHELRPDWVRENLICKRYEERIASIGRSKARQPEMAEWLGNIPSVTAERDIVLASVEPVLARFGAIIEASGIEASELAWSAAADAADEARDALLAYRPQTMRETRAVAAALWRRCKANGSWYELPALAFIEALCPELEGLAHA